MLYSAICVDNSKYFKTGTITVRIFAYYVRPRTVNGKEIKIDDFSKNPDFRTENKIDDLPDITEDFEAIVFAPLGGGRNYGIFSMPQINEKGVVAFLDNDFHKPIWLGSYFQPIRDENYKVEAVNFPNDKLEAEGENQDGAINQSSNLENDDNTLIIRTKHTNSASGDSMDWEKVHTENIIAVGKSTVKIDHITKWDDNTPKTYQQFYIHQNDDNKDEIMLKITNDKKEASLKLTEDGFSVEITDGNDTNTFEISLTDDGIHFEDKYGNKIIGTDSGLNIEVDSSNKVIIDANEIQLAGSGDNLVKYSDLSDIIDKLSNHIHIGSVPTTPPMDSSMAPLGPQLISPKNNMKANKVKTD